MHVAGAGDNSRGVSGSNLHCLERPDETRHGIRQAGWGFDKQFVALLVHRNAEPYPRPLAGKKPWPAGGSWCAEIDQKCGRRVRSAANRRGCGTACPENLVGHCSCALPLDMQVETSGVVVRGRRLQVSRLTDRIGIVPCHRAKRRQTLVFGTP